MAFLIKVVRDRGVDGGELLERLHSAESKHRPLQAPGLPLLLQELREFPTGRHDDLVDSFSMALARIPFSPPRPLWRIS